MKSRSQIRMLAEFMKGLMACEVKFTYEAETVSFEGGKASRIVDMVRANMGDGDGFFDASLEDLTDRRAIDAFQEFTVIKVTAGGARMGTVSLRFVRSDAFWLVTAVDENTVQQTRPEDMGIRSRDGSGPGKVERIENGNPKSAR